MTPSLRPEAKKLNDHHLLWRAKEWKHFSRTHNQVRLMGAYILRNVECYHHDLLHETFEPIDPPHLVVAQNMAMLGHEYRNYMGDNMHLNVARDLMGISKTVPTIEMHDQAQQIAAHLIAQVGFIKALRD